MVFRKALFNITGFLQVDAYKLYTFFEKKKITQYLMHKSIYLNINIYLILAYVQRLY